jgi:hypothetical protein
MYFDDPCDAGIMAPLQPEIPGLSRSRPGASAPWLPNEAARHWCDVQ